MTRRDVLSVGLALSTLAICISVAKTTASPPGIDGTIVSLDPTQRIRVANNALDYWFQCTADTTFTLNSHAATYDQLQAGQKAIISFDPTSYHAIRVDARTQ